MKSFTPYQERINRFLANWLEHNPGISNHLNDAIAYALLSPGKRIRPLLVYATSERLDLSTEAADHIAAAIEMIHAYSLIHDDLPAMDDDDLRRGRPTCHKAFDEATAILAGDALQAMAFSVVTQSALPAAVQIKLVQSLAHASGSSGMVGGQSLDLLAENKAADLTELKQIHQGKTGAILASSVMLPVLTQTNLSPTSIEHYQNLATHLGLAFQIQDDILDLTKDTQTLGKPSGSDEKNNKSTYPSLLGLDGAQSMLSEHVNQAHAALAALELQEGLLSELTHYMLNRQY